MNTPPPAASQSAAHRTDAGAEGSAEPFGAVIARVATQGAAEKSQSGGSARTAPASQGDGAKADAAESAATEAGPEASGEETQNSVAMPADEIVARTMQAEEFLAAATTPLAVPVAPSGAAVQLDDVEPAADMEVGEEALAALADGVADDAQDAPDAGDTRRTSQRGPSARAFAQANAHAQTALAAAGARHDHAGSDPAARFAAAVDATAVDVRELSAAATQAPRADAQFSATLAHAWPANAAPATSQAPTVHTTVGAPLTHPRFADEFGDKLVWLARGQVSSAEIAVTPSDLGPVRVSIEIRGNDATIHFGAAAAATRTAIEEALPRLREMLAQQGLNLTDANVGSQTARDEQHPNRSSARRERSLFQGEAAVPGPAPVSGARSLRLIDVIA